MSEQKLTTLLAKKGDEAWKNFVRYSGRIFAAVAILILAVSLLKVFGITSPAAYVGVAKQDIVTMLHIAVAAAGVSYLIR